MTEKQNQIIQSALKLVAKQGFHATSSKQIALDAQVSEGLIFRHFGSKAGLLKAILQFAHEKAATLFHSIDKEASPLLQLKQFIRIPFQIPESDFPFWKLIYSLKWQSDHLDDRLSVSLEQQLQDLFTQLDYPNPKEEAQVLLLIFDGAASQILLQKTKDKIALQQSIERKYNLNT